MRAYSSTQPVYNPLSTHINWQFAVALATLSEPYKASSDVGRNHNSNSPIYQDFGCYVFDRLVACPPLFCNNDLPLREIRLGPIQLHHPSVTRKTAA